MHKPVMLTLGLLALAPAGRADDLRLPPWQRFAAGTTYQTWTFSAPAAGNWWPDPGGYGDSTMFGVFGGYSWLPEYAGRQGVFAGEGATCVIGLPAGHTYIDIYLQIVSHADGQMDAPVLTGKGVPVEQQIVELINEFPRPGGDGGWWYRRWHMQGWNLPPPEFGAFVAFFGGSPLIDQIVIDWVPEPGTGAALLALAVLALRHRTSVRRACLNP